MIDPGLKLSAIFGDQLKENEPMSKHTNFRLGGNARWFAVAQSEEEILRALDVCDEHGIPWMVTGGGSNMLVADEGYPGLMIQLGMRKIAVEGTRVTAEAGVLSVALARAMAEAGFKGFAWAISLPGTIGGAVRGNAGCFGGETAEYFVSARVIRHGRIVEMSKEELAFGYRDSILKHEPGIVLSATFEFPRGNKAELMKQMDAALAGRKATQPLHAGSAGCIFKNIELGSGESLQRAGEFSDIVGVKEMIARRKIPSGWLIDHLGLKGTQVGGAAVSQEHGNFIINTGNATARDVYQLAKKIKNIVAERSGLEMEEEVEFVGFSSFSL